MKITNKEFLILNLKDHYWDYDRDDECLLSSYYLSPQQEIWYETFYDELFDFIEYHYDSLIDYEIKNYNESFYIKFDFNYDYLHDNHITEKELKNELSLIAKTILQENTVYKELYKDEVSYIDQYDQKTNIMYTNLCEVKNEREDRQTIIFTNMIKKLEKDTVIEIKYTNRNTALVSYKGYAEDLNIMIDRVKSYMDKESMNESKIIFAEPMLKETSIRYDEIKKWIDSFREFYKVEEVQNKGRKK